MEDMYLIKLCKELHEKTSRELPISNKPIGYWIQKDGEWAIEYSLDGMPEDVEAIPLYDLEFLMEKLPLESKIGKTYDKNDPRPYFAYIEPDEDFVQESDTALKAVLLLLLALTRADDHSRKMGFNNRYLPTYSSIQ